MDEKEATYEELLSALEEVDSLGPNPEVGEITTSVNKLVRAEEACLLAGYTEVEIEEIKAGFFGTDEDVEAELPYELEMAMA